MGCHCTHTRPHLRTSERCWPLTLHRTHRITHTCQCSCTERVKHYNKNMCTRGAVSCHFQPPSKTHMMTPPYSLHPATEMCRVGCQGVMPVTPSSAELPPPALGLPSSSTPSKPLPAAGGATLSPAAAAHGVDLPAAAPAAASPPAAGAAPAAAAVGGEDGDTVGPPSPCTTLAARKAMS